MEEFCRRKFISSPDSDCQDSPACPVTQIPLEPSRPDCQEQSNTRPPWIRPVRKKTPNMVKGTGSDGGSHQSSPEAFSPSEFFVDPTGGLTSPQPGQSFSPTSTTGGPTGQYLSANRRSSLTLPSFLDTSATMEMDPSVYMSSPVEVLSMFGDNSVDVSSIFNPDFNMGQHSTESSDSLYGHLGGGSLVTTP